MANKKYRMREWYYNNNNNFFLQFQNESTNYKWIRTPLEVKGYVSWSHYGERYYPEFAVSISERTPENVMHPSCP